MLKIKIKKDNKFYSGNGICIRNILYTKLKQKSNIQLVLCFNKRLNLIYYYLYLNYSNIYNYNKKILKINKKILKKYIIIDNCFISENLQLLIDKSLYSFYEKCENFLIDNSNILTYDIGYDSRIDEEDNIELIKIKNSYKKKLNKLNKFSYKDWYNKIVYFKFE